MRLLSGFFILIVFAVPFKVLSQSQNNPDSLISALSSRIDSLEKENSFLKGRITELENLKSTLLKQLVEKGQGKYVPPDSTNSSTSVSNKDKPAETKAKVFRRCKAILKNGKRCSRAAQPGSDYCWQHQNKN